MPKRNEEETPTATPLAHSETKAGALGAETDAPVPEPPVRMRVREGQLPIRQIGRTVLPEGREIEVSANLARELERYYPERYERAAPAAPDRDTTSETRAKED